MTSPHLRSQYGAGAVMIFTLAQDLPLKADKGKQNGSCNRRACQAPGATWFNAAMNAYYCPPCARAINRECRRFGDPLLCEPLDALTGTQETKND